MALRPSKAVGGSHDMPALRRHRREQQEVLRRLRNASAMAVQRVRQRQSGRQKVLRRLRRFSRGYAQCQPAGRCRGAVA